jgi:NADH dehydrogenase
MTEIPAETLVTVFGGSGFLGRHVVRALARAGYRVRPAVRRPDLAFHLQPMGRVGQIHPVQANLRYPASIEAAVRDADVVINLVGILFERGKQRFEAVHAEGARHVAAAAAAAGARLVHVSALGADPSSPSLYARTKAAAEVAVLGAAPDVTIFRPSIIFGPEDDFFNRFAAMARMSPALPLVGGGATKFQPVYVGDVAQAIVKAVGGTTKGGTIYELGGPDVRSFRELMEFVLTVTERRRMLVPLPFGFAKLQASILRAIADIDMFWVEIDTYSPEALGYIRRASPHPISSCETLLGLREFLPYFKEQAMDVAIIDTPWNGVWQSMKIAASAEAHEVNVAPHNFSASS